jgi:hypothetical protein
MQPHEHITRVKRATRLCEQKQQPLLKNISEVVGLVASAQIEVWSLFALGATRDKLVGTPSSCGRMSSRKKL